MYSTLCWSKEGKDLNILVGHLLRQTVYQMFLPNLRNQRLSNADIWFMSKTIPSLYHNLGRGSKRFPVIPCQVDLTSELLVFLFLAVEQNLGENTPLSLLTEEPAHLMAPPAGAAFRPILLPVLPDKANLGLLREGRTNSAQWSWMDARWRGCVLLLLVLETYRRNKEKPQRYWWYPI